MGEEIILTKQDGRAVVSSRNIAEKFNKEHDKVYRDIRNLLKSQPTKLTNEFLDSEYTSDRGRKYKRDGFSLLTMGFTGKEVLDWKLKYIEAFNKMKASIQNTLSNKDVATLAILK